jgi:Peptidase family M48
MSFLNWPNEEVLPRRHIQQRRRRVVLDLLDKFGRAFPEITYELFWESSSVNAQAWRRGSDRYVRVYGGLVRHPAITKYGLALMLAHETGHHLGGPPCDPAMPWLTWQGQADYWAARTAMPKIWGPGACGATLRAAREMMELHRLLASQLEDDEPDLSPDCRYRIWYSGAHGNDMPRCALEALASISDDN